MFICWCWRSPCSKLDVPAVSCHYLNPNVLRAKEILKFDLLADLNECLGSPGQIDSVVFISASSLFYFWLFTLPLHLSPHTTTLKEPNRRSSKIWRKISILLCSKCFNMTDMKRGIQERADKFFVALFLSCKEPCREKSNPVIFTTREPVQN